MVDCDAPDANRFATDVPEMTGRAANAAFLPGRKADAKWLVETWGIAEQRAVTWFNLQVQLRHDTDPVRHGDLHFVFVIDEIQKIPRWSEVIKGLWDDARARNIPMHVVLLGSSPLLIQQGLSESLMGRFELLRMTHWTLAEMQQAFGISVDEYLHFGAYPGATELRADEGRWRDYVRYSLVKASIENDVLAMQRIDKPALLQQLFEIGCQSSGQIVALNKILGQLDDAGNTTTLANYLQLVSHAGLLTGLLKHSKHLPRRRREPPKFQVLNTALLTLYSHRDFASAKADRSYWGHVVESAVGAHLVNTADDETEVRYWRESPHEVDFVVCINDRVTAIEVKSGPVPSKMPGLQTFIKRHPGCNYLIVGSADLSLETFLREPARHWVK